MAYSPLRVKILAVIYTLLIAGIVFLSDLRETQFIFHTFAEVPYGDKLGHIFVMGFFSFVVNLVFNARSVKIFGIRYLMGSMIVFGVVTIEEFSQIMVRGRNFEISDLISNYIGIFIFGELARYLMNRRNRSLEETE